MFKLIKWGLFLLPLAFLLFVYFGYRDLNEDEKEKVNDRLHYSIDVGALDPAYEALEIMVGKQWQVQKRRWKKYSKIIAKWALRTISGEDSDVTNLEQ